jgi:hypothetical protein
MPGQWLPPDHTRGDANTIGGYMRVHARPAAFEGSDGRSYSVAVEVDATGDPDRPYGAYFLFLRWRRIGAQGVDGHLETGYATFGATPEAAREALGAWLLADVHHVLEEQIREGRESEAAGGGDGGAGRGRPERRWWDVMRDEE